MRPMCKTCRSKPRAVAYHKYDRIYYRNQCDSCIRKKRRMKPAVPRWQSAGYNKKPACDRCGFRARHHSQLMVYHVNGDLNDCDGRNLKTVCQNCAVIITRQDLPWRAGDLEPDL